MADNNNHEVLEAIHGLATHMDERFSVVDKRFDGVDKRLDGVDKRLDGVDKHFEKVEKDIGKLRSDLIDHVERTINNAKGDIIKTIKTDRERQKLFNTKILTMLERGKIARPEEAEALRELVA